MSQIERGRAGASMPPLRRLAAFYGVPLAYLFEDAQRRRQLRPARLTLALDVRSVRRSAGLAQQSAGGRAGSGTDSGKRLFDVAVRR